MHLSRIPFTGLCQKPLAFKLLVFPVKICYFQNNQKEGHLLVVTLTELTIPNLRDKESLSFASHLWGEVGARGGGIRAKKANRLIFCPLKELKTNLNKIGLIVWSHP